MQIPLDSIPLSERPIAAALRKAFEIAHSLLPLSRGKIEKALSSLEPGDVFDAYVTEHMRDVLQALLHTPHLITMVTTLGEPPPGSRLQKIVSRSGGDVQVAVLSALLFPLRQNVGACFATAPGILIQREQVENLLLDLTSLLTNQRITRVKDGVEFSVPMSPSLGVGMLKKSIPQHEQAKLLSHFALQPEGETIDKCKAALHERETIIDLTDHALLKMWEYTIASFSDYSTEIFKWNLHASMGFERKSPGGIADWLYSHISLKLEEANTELEEVQKEFELTYMRVKMTESLLKQADSPEKARRLKMEHNANVDHFYACKEKRNDLENASENYSKFFAFLLEKYSQKLPAYFQEIFDADMVESERGIYEDSPAGFRLLFKHGRQDPSVWTFIRTEREYTDALGMFFRMTEHEITEECEWERGKEEVGGITTSLMHHVQTEDFVKSAQERIVEFHKKHNIELGKYKTPWSYVSGGGVITLLQGYYTRSFPPHTMQSRVESPLDLLTFYLEAFKELPPRIMGEFIKNPHRRMLATSPNHVFSIMPGWFQEAWDNSLFTYTWIRDQIIEPQVNRYKTATIDTAEVYALHGLPAPAGCTTVPLRELDRYVSLPPQMVDSAILALHPIQNPFVIGDTNWADYFFSFVVSPRTGELELWRTNYQGTRGVPMMEWSTLFPGNWTLLPEITEYSENLSRHALLDLKKV